MDWFGGQFVIDASRGFNQLWFWNTFFIQFRNNIYANECTYNHKLSQCSCGYKCHSFCRGAITFEYFNIHGWKRECLDDSLEFSFRQLV